MPTFVFPDSNGEDAAPLREYNTCHLPAGQPTGGQFCGTGGEGLPESPSVYFEIDARTVLVPLDQVEPTRARPKGIANAEVFMAKAARGEMPRRKPILLQKVGKIYKVLDGNSTTAIAKKHGWLRIPAHIQESRGVREHGDPDRPGPYPHAGGRAGAVKTGYQRPTPIRTSDINEALRLIAAGKVVELPDIRTVNTLIRKLGAMAIEAKASGADAAIYNLCNVTVPGTNLFCAEHKNIRRVDMPQFSGRPVPGSPADKLPRNPRGNVDGADAFMAHLKGLGVATTREQVPAARLKATQRTLEGVTVGWLMTQGQVARSKPIFISRDGYVVDGHHRWAAEVGLDAEDGRFDTQMEIIRIDAPIAEILFLGRAWAKSFGFTPKGSD